ncbi:cytochrome b5-like [Triticum dicoccoides]|uniref:cytochrome b5-like n=1 Tax=Triticum dicoccoides TaxID=85692 RepID=UPI0018912082|nr:cytochrome b5-like [Triticum dicoccoides]
MAEETETEKPLFSPADVSLHASTKDCWVVIHGKVYDVTKFLEDHPGGEDVLLHASASGDATEAFEDVGHSTSAISMMSSYLIGSIEDYVPRSTSKDATVGGSNVLPNSRTMQRNKGSPAPNTFLDFVLPLCMLVLAFAAWYYLTFMAES